MNAHGIQNIPSVPDAPFIPPGPIRFIFQTRYRLISFDDPVKFVLKSIIHRAEPFIPIT